MAEAGVETATSSARFFCHKCNVEITPQLPDYVCPRCNSGFIEELERTHVSDSDSSSDTEMEPFDMLNLITQEPPPIPGASAASTASSSVPGPRISQRLRHLNPRHSRRRVSGGDRHSALAPLIHDLIMQMTSGVIEASVGGTDYVPQMGIDWPGFPVLVASNLASNPGDYAWGRGGLDTIITQLMNQLDGTGPPPLTKEQISQIPTSKITKEQCDKGLQCSVCMEDFTVDESVRRLDCDHFFHNDCIIPWLELHGTCPICRKLLEVGGRRELGTPSVPGENSPSSGPR
ncbi:E3 ubiquitin-protein ligase RNF126-like isoform X2 [Eriocheir sinensis]|nr:E3 ubiquitin-protein ligase RNF126-like isoform X2 [Eriocheir sinensis]